MGRWMLINLILVIVVSLSCGMDLCEFNRKFGRKTKSLCYPELDAKFCPKNMIIGCCGECTPTCDDPTGTIECSSACEEKGSTCICPLNYLMDGKDCIRQEDCGCYKHGYGVIARSSTVVFADCTESCTCSTGGLTCETLSCHQEATCRLKDGARDCYCDDGYQGDGRMCARPFKDCHEIKTFDDDATDGNYLITPTNWTGGDFTVNCNMTIDSGGWTVIQRRFQSSWRRDFYQNWTTYETGFGEPSGEFWIGNEKLHLLTNQKDYELRIDMVDVSHDPYNAKYDLFRIDGGGNNYRLSGLGDFTGTIGFDSMRYHYSMSFSTPGSDNDRHSGHCADDLKGGWWYNACYHCDLNTMQFSSVGYWSPSFLIYTEMKIRPRGTN